MLEVVIGSKQIKNQIEKTFNDEERTDRLAGTVRTVAGQNGINLPQEQVNEIVTFAKEYIQHIPLFISSAIANLKHNCRITL